MTHGSLFSGIGGFDLAAQWVGWENKFHCEWNEFGQKVLNYYWPNAESFHDITKTDFTKYDGTIDIISGGFPCQPYSVAGKRLGKDDERHLWPEMLRAIQEIKPRWVVGENVRGLVGWNEGLVFHEVQSDLEAQGYEVQPFLIPAAGVNAPHKRDRVWFIAYANNKGRRSKFENISQENGEISKWNNDAESCDSDNKFTPDSESQRQPSQQTWSAELQSQIGEALYGRSSNTEIFKRDVADSECIRLEHGSSSKEIRREKKEDIRGEEYKSSLSIETMGYGCKSEWENFPTVSPICDGDDGLSSKLDSITFSKWRKESIKAGGNAIVPNVAFQIFKAIEEYEKRFGSSAKCSE